MAAIWKTTPFMALILLAGLQLIPHDLFEAAALDGASRWAAFRHITLPLLVPVLAVTTVLNLVYALRVFDVVYVLTNGGPGYATSTVYTVIFDQFSLGQWGPATALSSVFLGVMLVISLLVLLVTRRSQVA